MTSFGQHYVVPAVGRCQQRYQEVHVELLHAHSSACPICSTKASTCR